MKRITSIFLILALVLSVFAGCGEKVGEIAGNVADVARAELENQVKALLEEYKLDVVEIRTTAGELNGSGKLQFFCGVLVQANSESVPQGCADALAKIFEDAGVQRQTGSKIESAYLTNKELSFKFSEFEAGKDYYLIYAYTSKLPSLSTAETK